MCPSRASERVRTLSPKRLKKGKKSVGSPYKSSPKKGNRTPGGVDVDVVRVVDMFSRSNESLHKRNLSN
jgi:hypothetical protein